MSKVSYHVMRNRVLEADIEEIIEALDIGTKELLDLIEDAGYDGLVEKAFYALEGLGNVTDNEEEDDDC